MSSRAQMGPINDWMRTADKWLLGAFGALMVVGLVLALAASPAVAERIGLSPFHFVNRQALFMAPTAALMIATSFCRRATSGAPASSRSSFRSR